MKKCLSGNGQIDIESDESVLEMAKVAYSQKKVSKCSKILKRNGIQRELVSTPSFLGVVMTSNGVVLRKFVDAIQ